MLIAEFEEQSFIQVVFPHEKTDWREYLYEAQQTFVNIINAIRRFEPCVVICADVTAVQKQFSDTKNLHFIPYETNDTWARDISALCVKKGTEIQLLDFEFNGWGGKFDAQKDNALNHTIETFYTKKMLHCDFILEGGAVESNGRDLLLTTATCMLNPNRHKNTDQEFISTKLKECFGAKQILYLHHGYLAGDDTDSHIDTLARFISHDTIMYVTCKDTTDEHYHALLAMEQELQTLAHHYNLKLIALPMSDPIYFEGERLPATYANFLFLNGAVLVPTYGVAQDSLALEIFERTFPQREIVAVDCSTLIRQHGSLHCVTMNFARGVGIAG